LQPVWSNHSPRLNSPGNIACWQHFSFARTLDYCDVRYRFSFGPNDKLAFTVRWNGGDNGYNASWYGVIDTGIWETVNTSYTTPGNSAATSYAAAWLWSDQTRLTISPAPVPEPSQAMLALAGLLALGLARLRSTRQDQGLTQ
jgi:hypothetical protein